MQLVADEIQLCTGFKHLKKSSFVVKFSSASPFMCWLLVDELLNFPCKVGHKLLPKSHIILVCKLYVDDIFVELDIVEDEVEIFEFDAETCSRTFAGALWPLRRRIAAFFSAIEANYFNHNDSLSNVTSLRPPRHDWCSERGLSMIVVLPAMILWKGLSLIDSWTHLIHPSLSSSVAVDSLQKKLSSNYSVPLTTDAALI